MRSKAAATLVAGLLALLLCAPAAGADEGFGLKNLAATLTKQGGAVAVSAGEHPYSFDTTIDFNTTTDPKLGEIPIGAAKDLEIELPPGLLADRSALPTCPAAIFLESPMSDKPDCPDDTVLGTTQITVGTTEPGDFTLPVYNMDAPRGTVLKLGFIALGVPVTIEAGLSPNPPYNGVVSVRNISQAINFYATQTTVWGDPADASHNAERGSCLISVAADSCPVSGNGRPFMTLPRSCDGPLTTTFSTRSWQDPATWLSESVQAQALGDCAALPFGPTITAQPTNHAATSPSGLDFSLDVTDEGLTSPAGRAASDIEKAVVTLPEGMSINPSQAEGLAVCTQADLAAESVESEFGAGCPAASKIGTVEAESELLPGEIVHGSLFVAAPYENPFGSLIALYIVAKDPDLGILVTQAAKVVPDPHTGQLTTITEEMPRLPFSHVRLRFREGARSPLVTPPACGSYDVKALLYPYSGTPPVTSTSTFQVRSGPDAGSCPTGGLPPLKPGLIAGTLNNSAGSFSPFNLRLFRSDSEQEFTHFSIKLPPGITGKLAGIPPCPEAAIAAAKAREGTPHGGSEELASPSCPAASEIGRTLVGSGVGSSLAYAPGKLYLAGPYNGSAISLVAITAGVVGPFDIGTVVVRQAFRIDPETAEVFIDATGSDPIPHIVQGIPVHLRDVRAYTDRPQFVLNPTSCKRTSTSSTVLGSGLDFVSAADDNPVTVSTPFQAADCAALPFKPKLSFRLVGGTKRGAHPSLRAHLKMNGIGEAAIAHAQVTLPRSEFIENAHFNTICTRTQFKAAGGHGEACPPGSIYGRAKAVTPILDEPLEGPVFLRSSEHKLPDVVASLHSGKIDVHLVGRVDSVKGQLRNTFEVVPDAPVSTFDLTLLGQKKGLFVNSTNLCRGKHRALAEFTAHSGKVFTSRPELKAKCGKKGKSGAKGHKRRSR